MRRLFTLTLICLCLVVVAASASTAQEKGAADPVNKEFGKAGLISFYDAANDVTGVYTLAMGLTGRWGTSTGPESLLAASLGARPEGVRFSVYFTYPGKVYTKPRQVTLKLAATNRLRLGFTRGVEAEVAVAADGVSLHSGKSSVETKSYRVETPKPGADYVDQVLEIPLTAEEFGRLAAAKKAEVIIEGRSIPLQARHLKALRRIADVIGEAK